MRLLPHGDSNRNWPGFRGKGHGIPMIGQKRLGQSGGIIHYFPE